MHGRGSLSSSQVMRRFFGSVACEASGRIRMLAEYLWHTLISRRSAIAQE